MTKWRRWRALSRDERRLLFRALGLMTLSRLTLSFVRFRAASHTSAGSARPFDLARAQAIAGLVAIAARSGPVPVTCLPRAVTLWRLLRRHGIACDLRLGVRRGADGFAAHAWVECAGVPLAEDPSLLARNAAFPRPVVPYFGWFPQSGPALRP